MTDSLTALQPLAGSLPLAQDSGLPSTGVILLALAILVVQLALLVAALVDVLRRPDEAVTGGRRWVWILVIVLVQTIGPLAYFAAGRRPRPAAEPSPRSDAPDDTGPSSRVDRAVEVLYGRDAADASGPPPQAESSTRPGEQSSADGGEGD
jgi:hypothetical protein